MCVYVSIYNKKKNEEEFEEVDKLDVTKYSHNNNNLSEAILSLHLARFSFHRFVLRFALT